MSLEVIIYDYVDDSGQNLLSVWMNGLGVRPKAKINNILYALREIPPQEWHKSKVAKKLKAQPDLWEVLAFTNKVQYRLFGFFGSDKGTFTLLVGAIKKGDRLRPISALNTAQQRKANVQRNPQRYRRHHVYK